jgi:BMFP domain-containing protein YqiC
MQSQNRFFEDLSRMANGAAGTFAGAAREFEGLVKQGVERFVGGMDLVRRDEFEAVKEMAATARAEADALKARLDAMEAKAARPKKA